MVCQCHRIADPYRRAVRAKVALLNYIAGYLCSQQLIKQLLMLGLVVGMSQFE